MTELNKGRVILSHYSKYIVEAEGSKYSCEVSGRFKYTSFNKSDYPIVGDYVLFRETNPNEGIIERVEERISVVKRLALTNVHDAQIVATNVNILFICMALDLDFNIKKFNNFMSMSYSTDYETIILLTKSDVGSYIDKKLEQIKVSTNHDIHVVSAFKEEDIKVLEDIIGTKTCVFLGSSGVGKSTLVNKLLGYDHMETNEVRVSDSQGRHTTVHRELIHLPSGGTIIDTPGVRLPKSYYTEDIDTHFEDIFELSRNCKFRDCTHTTEVGCKVQESLDDGGLSPTRYNQYIQAEKVNKFTIKREKQKLRIQEKRMQKRR